VIPIFYALPVYIVTWAAIRGSLAFSAFASPLGSAFGFPDWPRATALFLAVPCYATVGVVASTARALGEEIGWRGFLLPRLVQQTGFTLGCFLSGCIWAVWHYPGLLFADYNAGTRPAFALTCFTLMVIADSYILGWLRLKSGSLWTAAVLHASHNLFIQAILDRMTAPVGRALYITTEFGAGLVLTAAACALYLWTRRKEVVNAG
jgi:membrane protease YdiL (CAAX protease family)